MQGTNSLQHCKLLAYQTGAVLSYITAVSAAFPCRYCDALCFALSCWEGLIEFCTSLCLSSPGPVLSVFSAGGQIIQHLYTSLQGMAKFAAMLHALHWQCPCRCSTTCVCCYRPCPMCGSAIGCRRRNALAKPCGLKQLLLVSRASSRCKQQILRVLYIPCRRLAIFVAGTRHTRKATASMTAQATLSAT